MHQFTGKWITDEEFYMLSPRNVFHRQKDPVDLPCEEHRNRHILFRKSFMLDTAATDASAQEAGLPAHDQTVRSANIYITADDYYKLYINGSFVAQGPAPSYHFEYNYNVIDVSAFLKPGKNVIAVHTLYQGLINRVWQSGDNRHGMLLDLEVNGNIIVSSDETFKTAVHGAYRETGTVGYQTQFLEEYDSRQAEVFFEQSEFDDSTWQNARIHQCSDHTPALQKSSMLVFEKITPAVLRTDDTDNSRIFVDFGSTYVGYLCVAARGKAGDVITIRCAQELNEDCSLRHKLRANCNYEEQWILADGESILDWFDYKSFRYAELILPKGCVLSDIYMNVRHYPFTLTAKMKPEYADNKDLQRIWDLCVHTLEYGIQEVIQDCMEREKGFYLGDGCYTVLAHMLLTGDDSMARKLIDDAFTTTFITESLVTCMDCSFMQEIAEYPLMLVYLVLWHYKLTQDTEYLRTNYTKVINLLETYRKAYENDGLIYNLDKWCVVEWPDNFRDGYDVEIKQGIACNEPHVSINAYYIEAVKTANKIAQLLNLEPYRDEKPLITAFTKAFYHEEKHVFKDGANTEHISIIGNTFPFAFGLCPDKQCEENIVEMFRTRKISTVSLFCAFLALEGMVRNGREAMVKEMLLDEGAWLRILREDGTTTFEGWGRDTKWNTSLFHLTMSYAAVFMVDVDLRALLSLD